MKQTFTSKQTLKQKLNFNTALYHSLDILKLSSYELLESVFEAIQENPLLEIEDISLQSNDNFDIWSTISKPDSLKDCLFFQLHTTPTPHNKNICTYIIESLDSHGFFTENLQECARSLQISELKLRQQLNIIKSFEPAGVAAESCIDALKLQAQRLNEQTAFNMLTFCSSEISKKQFDKIAKKLNCSIQEITRSFSFIQSLSPYPCSSFQTEEEQHILPDVKIEIEDNKILLSPISHFQIQYNDSYTDLMKQPVLKKYFEESKVLISNINKRNSTMLLVINEIVNKQSGYFLYQDELKPLKQSDISNTLGMNQTTVSRAILNKYYQFENEIYPVSNLFVTSTTKGDSSDAIKKAIREIISQENKAHPLSDIQIVKKLEEFDYQVSRRTVTKYRESCHIKNTRARKIK